MTKDEHVFDIDLADRFEWRSLSNGCLAECYVEGKLVAWITTRPHYCDRGHYQVNCDLPSMDGADGFPRYYMRASTAKIETEMFLAWRLWKRW